jgi:hypothetical protein
MIMKKIEQPRITRPALRATEFILFALAILVCQSGNTAAQTQWTTAANGTDIYATNPAAKVGIGTAATPTGVLQVQSNDNDAGNGTAMAVFKQTNGGGFPYVQLDRALPARSNTLIFSTAGIVDWSLGTFYNNGDKNYVFSIANSAGFTPYLSQGLFNITSGGSVGIGTATPQATLDVAGSGNFSGTVTGGNIIAKYQDVAEWVPSSEQLATGTVVVLDSNRANEVIASTQSYDTRVAGVISAQPGISLGENGPNKVLVATTGRVRVKVDASRAPIQIGDLLVTSDIPGVAMKSEPVEFAGRKMHMPGTIIGKALEPLAKGSGEILVLLSLQ